MLQSMRQLAHAWPVKIVMMFLAISFSIWGIGDIFRGNPLQKTVASVGNTNISVQDLNQAFDKALAFARQKLSPDLTAQQARQVGLLDKTLEDETKRALLTQDLRRLGLDVPQSAILKLISDQKSFRKPDGSFDKERFHQALAQQGLTEQSFIQKTQQDVAQQMLLSALNAAQPVPQTILDALYRARARKHILDVVMLDASKLTGIPAPDDKALHDFYNENVQAFAAPEYRTLTLASLSTDDLAKTIVISDDQVKKEYDSKIAQLSNPEQRDIVQVIVQDQDKAKQLAAQARVSKDLAATAKINHETAVPLEKMEQKNLLPELAKAVFALPANGVSDPVKTQLGWHIIQIKKITPPGTPSFDGVKDSLRDDMQHDQAIESATRMVNQLDDALASGHSLDDIAEDLKLHLVKIAAVDSKGLTPDGKEPTEFPNKPETLKEAFAQNAGETSPIEDDKNGNYIVVRTDDVTPAAAKPFDVVKDQVAKAWKVHQQSIKAQAQAAKIETEMRNGKSAASFNGQEGISIRTSPPLTELGDTDALLPKDLVMQALKLKQGETASTSVDGKEIIIRVASLIDADMSKPDPRRGMIGLQVKQEVGDDRIQQYLKYLESVFPVKINHAVLDQLRQQDN